jgi:hypothetical protein
MENQIGKMSRLPDLVRDSKLETHFLPDCSVETVHTYHESDPSSRRRVVVRYEHWKRQRRIGGGGYSTVWLEECFQGSRDGVQVRAVKQIETGGRFQRIDFNRELETIAKFSHSRVCSNDWIECFKSNADCSNTSMKDALFNPLGGIEAPSTFRLRWSI